MSDSQTNFSDFYREFPDARPSELSNGFRVIAFTGKMGHGKTTCANHLEKNYGFARVSFAQPLKDAAFAVFGEEKFKDLMQRQKNEPSETLLGNSPRHVLQTLGTEWGRNLIHPDLWTTLAKRKVFEIRREGFFHGVVFDDLRFENEAEMVKKQLGGRIIKVAMKEETPAESWFSKLLWWKKQKQHASESGIDMKWIDAIIENDRDIPYLLDRVEQELEFLYNPFILGV